MKSFVSTLTQASRPVHVVGRKDIVVPTLLRSDYTPEHYVAALDSGDLSTVELANMFNVSPIKAMKVLQRLEADLRVRRSGTEKSGGTRKTVVWSTSPEPVHVLPVSKSPAERITFVLSGATLNTRQLATALNLQYYSTLATCKRLELAGVVRRDGVDRTKPKTPHIIWKLK